jgi:predicted TIM-barrel fold metal-dependent hydrolase
MSSTVDDRSPLIETQAEGSLIDADGHLFEDQRAIADRLDQPYRDVYVKEHWRRLFPPIGYLNSMPFDQAELSQRDQRESGLSPDSWLYFLDQVGIEMTVLYPTMAQTINRSRDLDFAISVCRAYNDWVHETYLKHPSGKFRAVALIPMQEPPAAAAELKRAVTELGFVAGVAQAHGMPNHLGSNFYFPVYEMAQTLDVGLTFHGAGFEGLGFDDFNVYAAAHALGHPIAQLKALAGMIFNGVFEQFPGLRIGYLEAGAGWILMAGERFTESYKFLPPLPSDRLLMLPKDVSALDYLRGLMADGRIVLGCEGGEHHLATAIDYLECQPFMYASDFPHEVSVKSCLHELEELAELDIDDEARQLLRGGTARRFYKL